MTNSIVQARLILCVLIGSIFQSCATPPAEQYIDTSDIPKFWAAYDEVVSTTDREEQLRLLDSLYVREGSAGLRAMMTARNYGTATMVDIINRYPNFWRTVRPNTLRAEAYADDILAGLEELRTIYPELKPATIYFTIGALRSGGTTLSDKVLIGAELALADSTVATGEFEGPTARLSPYIEGNLPAESIVFTNVHEYVHTQQDTTVANSLLSRTLIEGVAEFVAELALGGSSPSESVVFGKANDRTIKRAFTKEMFTEFESLWFWGNANNELGVIDPGYYVGYAICDSYYDRAADKQRAIRDMIKLNYLSEEALVAFVDSSGYFDRPVAAYRQEAEARQPRVVDILEFDNQSVTVDPSIRTMTLQFSAPMNVKLKNLRLGPLGEDHLLAITDLVGWSDDKTRLTYAIDLQPNLRQQLLITDIFRSEEGYLLEPFLVDIKTTE